MLGFFSYFTGFPVNVLSVPQGPTVHLATISVAQGVHFVSLTLLKSTGQLFIECPLICETSVFDRILCEWKMEAEKSSDG